MVLEITVFSKRHVVQTRKEKYDIAISNPLSRSFSWIVLLTFTAWTRRRARTLATTALGEVSPRRFPFNRARCLSYWSQVRQVRFHKIIHLAKSEWRNQIHFYIELILFHTLQREKMVNTIGHMKAEWFPHAYLCNTFRTQWFEF